MAEEATEGCSELTLWLSIPPGRKKKKDFKLSSTKLGNQCSSPEASVISVASRKWVSPVSICKINRKEAS